MKTYNFIEIAKNNPDNKVTLDYGKGTFTFLITGDVSLDTGNSWNSPLDNSISKKLGGDSDAAKIGQMAISSYTGKNFDIKHVNETIKFYNGSESLDLSFSGILIANKETDNLNQLIKPLLDLTNPDFDPSGGLSFTLGAPLGYSPNNVSSQGKIAVKVGRWLKTSRVYLLDSAKTKISTAKLPNGKPSWIELDIKLVPFRLLSVKEVKSFLI